MVSSASTRAPRLEMQGIRKSFPGVVALDDVSLVVHAGEVHLLLGENGAGKSTLMKILSGAYRKDAGSIAIDGKAVHVESPRDALALGIRVIYQELNLVPQLSAAENIFLGSTPTTFAGVVDWRQLHTQTERLFDDLGMTITPAVPVRRLSLAQRQMVEIAKAVRSAPEEVVGGRILVMDEPTSALTTREVDQLFGLIERLRGRGVSIIYITHRLDELSRIGDRVTVMRDGRHISTQRLADTSIPALVRQMANREVSEHYPRQRRPGQGVGSPPPVLLQADRISRNGTLQDVNLTLRAGEILGIGGLLGAGRSELARVLAGADRPDSGRLRINGSPVAFRSPADAIQRGVGLLPEDRKADGLVANLTVARNIALPHGRTLARFGVLPSHCETNLATPIVNDLRVKATPTQVVRQLSGGNQQKVVLGKWLAGSARIFIFDEPTRGVDVGAKVEIYNLMNSLTASGAGIIMISSELPELLGMSDRILVMHRGRIHAEFDAASATQEAVLSAALGLAR